MWSVLYNVHSFLLFYENNNKNKEMGFSRIFVASFDVDNLCDLLPSNHIFGDHAYWFILDEIKHIIRWHRDYKRLLYLLFYVRKHVPVLVMAEILNNHDDTITYVMVKVTLKTRLHGYHDILKYNHFYRCWDTTSPKGRCRGWLKHKTRQKDDAHMCVCWDWQALCT